MTGNNHENNEATKIRQEPIFHDIDVFNEREELKGKLAGGKNVTVSIDISAEAYLKLAEKYDYFLDDPVYMFSDKDVVGKYLSKEVLKNFAKEEAKLEETRKRNKRYMKKKTK